MKVLYTRYLQYYNNLRDVLHDYSGKIFCKHFLTQIFNQQSKHISIFMKNQINYRLIIHGQSSIPASLIKAGARGFIELLPNHTNFISRVLRMQ